MPFHNESPFYKQPESPRPDFPVRHVGQPNIVEIPVPILEQWINSLELAENGGDIEDVLIDMRSYFRG